MTAVRKDDVASIRRFNRFYTRRIGALDAGHLGSRFSLTEVRVLYELAHAPGLTAGALARSLALDEGYLSRMIGRFKQLGLVRRSPSPRDARVMTLALTTTGRSTFAPLDRKADEAVRALLEPVSATERHAVRESIARVQSILDPVSAAEMPVRLRTHRPGDLGWIVHRHGVLYAREYGYDERFESIVAGVVAEFLAKHDPGRERCWIAERDAEVLGSVMLVRKSATTAKLRLLYLEPHARGLGLGRKLVDECIRFARKAGYRKITLWTQSSLTAARHIYQTAGFRMTASKVHQDFGPKESAETWEMSLR